MLERVTPEQNLEYDLELWRRGEKRGSQREAEGSALPGVEMRNSTLHSRSVGGVWVGERGSAGGSAGERG